MDDKTLTTRIVSLGVSHEIAREIVGLIVEIKQICDRQGYTRGFNDGYVFALKKFSTK